jgi:hypothetical protein
VPTKGFEHRRRVHLLAGADLTDLVHRENDGTPEHVVLAEEFDLDVRWHVEEWDEGGKSLIV